MEVDLEGSPRLCRHVILAMLKNGQTARMSDFVDVRGDGMMRISSTPAISGYTRVFPVSLGDRDDKTYCLGIHRAISEPMSLVCGKAPRKQVTIQCLQKKEQRQLTNLRPREGKTRRSSEGDNMRSEQ